MKSEINNKIFEQFPGLTIGIVTAKDIENSKNAQEIARLTDIECERIRKEFLSEKLSLEPKINCWREAYRLFNGKPKENYSSIENLYKNVLKGNNPRSINPLVDIYNYISLKYMLPLGGEDLDKMIGDLKLTYANVDEKPVKLLGDHEAKPPHEGEIIYKDDESAVCRRWNWREADRTKITSETTNAIIVIEALPPATKEEINNALQELEKLVQDVCGGELRSAILNKDSNILEI